MRLALITFLTLLGGSFAPFHLAYGQDDDDLARAGCPHHIARYARVGYNGRYVAYYVGGGAKSWRGEPRYAHEGTFGVDYQPIVPGFRNGVVLGWWHGRRQQGGPGQYEPNRLVPPLPNLTRN
ncbi:MAG: hypothetical protein JSS49_05105 [Planctomycetes bacterium]|nr:hypothetical protein [Planctomycetota bacterium]